MRIFGMIFVLSFASIAAAQEPIAPPPIRQPSPEEQHRAQVLQQVQAKMARVLKKAAAQVKNGYSNAVLSVPIGRLAAKPACASVESSFQVELKGCKFTFDVPATRVSARSLVTLQADLSVDIAPEQQGKKHSRKHNGTAVQFKIENGVVSVAPGSPVPALQAGIVADRKNTRVAFASQLIDQHESDKFDSVGEEDDDADFDPCGEVEAMPDFSRERGAETRCYSYIADERFNGQMRVVYQKDAGGRIVGVRAVGFGGNF